MPHDGNLVDIIYFWCQKRQPYERPSYVLLHLAEQRARGNCAYRPPVPLTERKTLFYLLPICLSNLAAFLLGKGFPRTAGPSPSATPDLYSCQPVLGFGSSPVKIGRTKRAQNEPLAGRSWSNYSSKRGASVYLPLLILGMSAYRESLLVGTCIFSLPSTTCSAPPALLQDTSYANEELNESEKTK